MKYYTYIFCDSDCVGFQTGVCKDIVKAIALFNKHNQLSIKPNFRPHVLVHLEVYASEQEAMDRMNEIFRLKKQQKEKLIEGSNPTWVELLPGINITI